VAIVKATYTNKGQGAKASIRYYQNRKDKEQTKTTRQLFGNDGAMERREAYRMIDEAQRGSKFYRFVISPDPVKEDTEKDLHLRDITEKTIQSLQEQFTVPILWVAAEHTNQTENRHVHVVAILPERLHKQDFKIMRDAATQASLTQRREHDLVRGQQERGKDAQWELQR